MALGETEDPRERLLRYVHVALFGPDDPAFDHWAFHAALLEFRVRALHDADIIPLTEGTTGRSSRS